MPRSQCRICLRYCSELVPLFKANIGEKRFTDLIYELLRIEFDPNPEYPRRVCELCVKKVNYLYSFYEDLVKSQALLEELSKTTSRKEARALIEAKGPSNYSDGIFEELEKLDEISDEDDAQIEIEETTFLENVEETEPVLENVEFEAVGFDDDRPVEEQLIDIKIEAVDEEECDMLAGKVSQQIVQSDEEEEFRGFEEPVPIKLTASRNMKRKRPKQVVPKLEIVETIPNMCYICRELSDSKDMFDLHLLTHSKMLPYKCENCSTPTAPVVIKTLVLLNKHFESHGFSYLCEYCPLRFRAYPSLYDHTRNFHTEHKEGFTCDKCGQVFIEIRKFHKHVRAHRNRDSERYKCKTCAKTFQTGTILRRHERIHLTDPLYACMDCKRTFNHEEQYHKHKLRHLQQQYNQQNGYSCKVCEAHFTCKADLRVHMQVHFPNNPNYSIHTDVLPETLRDSSSYPRGCEEPDCKYIAPSYTLMWSHYRNHYKLYHCQECDRKFATATILKNHVEVIHQKLRKFHCDQCPKTFAYQHKLKEHMNVHRGIRDRKCRFCGKCFTHSSNLLVHEKVHKNIKRHKCDICDSSYVTTSALKKHRKTHRTNMRVKNVEPDVEEDCEYIECEEETAVATEMTYKFAEETVRNKKEPEQEAKLEESELIYFMEDANEQVLSSQVEIEEGVTVKELCDILEGN